MSEYLTTLQLAWGGLFDSRPADGVNIHLIRGSDKGSHEALCGYDRHDRSPGRPGWSVGGGISGPDYIQILCEECASVAADQYPHLSIQGTFAASFEVRRGVLR
jgi:hypothetical protein